MAQEIRNIRVEDWEGNIYQFSGSGGEGGITSDATDIGKDKYSSTDGSVVEDFSSNNGVAIVTNSSTTTNTNIATICVSDVKFGKYSVMVRLKSSKITGTDPLIKIESFYFVDGSTDVKLSTTQLIPTMFESAEDYQTFGFVTNFKGVYNKDMKLKVVITLLPQTSPATVSFDMMISNYAYTALSGTSTEVF